MGQHGTESKQFNCNYESALLVVPMSDESSVLIPEETTPEQLAEIVARMEADLTPLIMNVYRSMGFEIVQGMKDRAPVKTGRLQNSIHMEELPNGIEIVVDVPYARIQEKLRHFLRDTLRELLPILRQRVAECFDEYMQNVGGR